MKDISGIAALVTGSSRGIGRGIAEELGNVGATVYVTGRSVSKAETTDGLPGTVVDAAELVTSCGGKGIPVACDHTLEEDNERLATQIQREQGKLDLLVNNVWGGYEQYEPTVWELPMWEQPLWRWDKMFVTGVRSHYLTTRAVAPSLLNSDNPLIINVSAGDEGKFLGDVQYDVAKNAIDRLAFALSRKLKRYGVTAITIHPGFTRTERIIKAYEGKEIPPETHSVEFVGRAVVALARDPEVSKRSGGVFKVGQLGLDYGFHDIDGSQPEPFNLPEGYGE